MLFVFYGPVTSSEEYVGFSTVYRYWVVSSRAKQQKSEEKNSPDYILRLVSSTYCNLKQGLGKLFLSSTFDANALRFLIQGGHIHRYHRWFVSIGKLPIECQWQCWYVTALTRVCVYILYEIMHWRNLRSWISWFWVVRIPWLPLLSDMVQLQYISGWSLLGYTLLLSY